MPNWRLREIICDSRPIKDALGHTLLNQPVQPGLPILQWCDMELATAWFQRARGLLNDTERLAKLNDAPKLISQAANEGWARDQLNYVAEILTAISNGYNALNILWYNDPEARRIYREYFPGLPDTTGGSGITNSIFGSSDNYRNNWYNGGVDTPFVGRGIDKAGDTSLGSRNHEFGKITQQIITGYRSFYPIRSRVDAHPLNLVLSANLVTTTPSGAAGAVDTALFVKNSFMVEDRYLSQRIGARPAAEPFTTRYPDFPNGMAVYYSPTGPVVFSRMPLQDDWRCVYFNTAENVYGIEATSEELGVAVGLQAYLPWLKDMTDAVLARTPGQVIQDARAFVVYMNRGMLDASGGNVASAIQLAVSTATDIQRQQTRYQGVFNAVGAGAAALGGALASSTYGISALVGGAIAATAAIAGAEFRAGFSGHGKDDLGRLKPVFERGWLGGDPANADVNEGAPQIDVPDPPGYRSPDSAAPGSDVDLLMRYGLTPGFTAQTTRSNSASDSGTNIGIFALTAAIGYAGWRIISQKPGNGRR